MLVAVNNAVTSGVGQRLILSYALGQPVYAPFGTFLNHRYSLAPSTQVAWQVKARPAC